MSAATLNLNRSHRPGDSSCSVDMRGRTDGPSALPVTSAPAPWVEMTISPCGKTLLISAGERSLISDVANDTFSILIRALLAFAQQKTESKNKASRHWWNVAYQHLWPKEAQDAPLWSKGFSSWFERCVWRTLALLMQTAHDWLKHCKELTIGIWHAVFSNGKQQNFPKDQPCGLHVNSVLLLDTHSTQHSPANLSVAKHISTDQQRHPFAIGEQVGTLYRGYALATPAFSSLPGGTSAQTAMLRKAGSLASSSSPSHVVKLMTWQITFQDGKG